VGELLVEVAILAILFAAILLVITLQICYVWILSTWVGLLSNGVGLFSREKVLENMSTPLSEHQSVELLSTSQWNF